MDGHEGRRMKSLRNTVMVYVTILLVIVGVAAATVSEFLAGS